MGRACFQGFGLESRNVACAEFNVSRFSLHVSRVIFTQNLGYTYRCACVLKGDALWGRDAKIYLGQHAQACTVFLYNNACTLCQIVVLPFSFFPPIHRYLADIVQDPQGIWLCLPLHPTEDTNSTGVFTDFCKVGAFIWSATSQYLFAVSWLCTCLHLVHSCTSITLQKSWIVA